MVSLLLTTPGDVSERGQMLLVRDYTITYWSHSAYSVQLCVLWSEGP